MSDYQEFPPESIDDTPLVYYFPSYFSLQETITSSKINSLIKCYNTLLEKFMQHNHTEGLNAYDEKTRAVKLAACACLVDGSIYTKCLANDCVTTIKILNQNVTTEKIKDLNVTTNKIADSAITTIKILDKNVTREKIADNAIDFSKIDSNSLDSIYNTMFNMMYPIGSTYITTLSYCPLQKGRWELITTAQSRVLQVASSPDQAGTTIEAGLPNIKGSITNIYLRRRNIQSLGALSFSNLQNQSMDTGGLETSQINLNFDASLSSSIYSDDVNTVQPPAFLINIFKRVE